MRSDGRQNTEEIGGDKAMYFKQIKLHEWQQFQRVEIDFHERLTVLTGANGSGKTTILNLLARHCGWNTSALATPKRERRSGVIRFLYRLFNGEDRSERKEIGGITYGNGDETALQVPDGETPEYKIQLPNQKPVKCFYIPSHGSVFRYKRAENISLGKRDKATAFREVEKITRNSYFGGSGGDAGSFLMKNTLIGWAIQGYGVQDGSRQIMPGDTERVGYYEGFQEVLRRVLPKTLGFSEFEIREQEIVFVCNDGRDEFVLETASGGISALINIAWQIYMYSTKENDEFTVLIDEVENHLHPTMQRQVLPDLLDAFPGSRFIVATHNPLIVGSVRDSAIYVLKYNDDNKVVNERLDFERQPKSASEILDEVLGVSFTMPVWVEDSLRGIVERYSHRVMDEVEIEQMRGDLAGVGLERLMPKAIGDVIRRQND